MNCSDYGRAKLKLFHCTVIFSSASDVYGGVLLGIATILGCSDPADCSFVAFDIHVRV